MIITSDKITFSQHQAYYFFIQNIHSTLPRTKRVFTQCVLLDTISKREIKLVAPSHNMFEA